MRTRHTTSWPVNDLVFWIALLWAVWIEHGRADPTARKLDHLFVEYNYNFTDSVLPVTVSFDPPQLAVDVALDAIITITFSELVKLGPGYILISSPGDIRAIPASDPQVYVNVSSNLTLALKPNEPLQNDVEYEVVLSPGVVTDLAQNQFQGITYQFRTAGGPTTFATFAHYVQGYNSPVIFSFKTNDACLYGSLTDRYHLHLWPSDRSIYTLEGSDFDDQCSRVFEASPNFPSIQSCKVVGGAWLEASTVLELRLRSGLNATTEYWFTMRWAVKLGQTTPDETNWHLVVHRQYLGIELEIQRFPFWRHRFGSYLYNHHDDGQGALISFKVEPTFANMTAEWLAPDTTREFRVELTFNALGITGGSRIFIFASPLSDWSVDPAQPSNLTMLTSLDFSDSQLPIDPIWRARPCTAYFPDQLAYTIQCHFLEIGMGLHAYGFELTLPSLGIGSGEINDISLALRLSIPGILQPLALVSYWEAFSVKKTTQYNNRELVGRIKESQTAAELNTTEGMKFRILSSKYAYVAPVGTVLNRVEIEFSTGAFFKGRGYVTLELLEPPKARIQACDDVVAFPRMNGQIPVISDVPVSMVRWDFNPALKGEKNFATYPRMRYRTSCSLYNGPSALPYSRWRLGVTTQGATGNMHYFRKEFISKTFYVASTLKFHQVVATSLIMGHAHTVIARFTIPVLGDALTYWAPARYVRLRSPPGFRFQEGGCYGFYPLTASSLPPLPLSSCLGERGAQSVLVGIDTRENGFQPGLTYAFRVAVTNPAVWNDVESRVVTGTQRPEANRWSLYVLQESDMSPLVMIEDVTQSYVSDTAALDPLILPKVYDSSFRVAQRQLLISTLSAEVPKVGAVTAIVIKFMLSTPLKNGNVIQITAPSAFTWIQQRILDTDPVKLGGTTPLNVREPTIDPKAKFIFYGSVVGRAYPSTQYGLIINITNPSADSWGPLDADLNFWVVETYDHLNGLLDKNGRRDAGVRQGYRLLGALMYCGAYPFSRVKGEQGWSTLTVRIGQSVLMHSYTQHSGSGASRLRIRTPDGFFIAGGDTDPGIGTNCSDVVRIQALAETPALPVAQHPHTYSALPDASDLRCVVSEAARVITIAIGDERRKIGMLGHLLYAFALKIVNPLYDRIVDNKWTLQTLDIKGIVFDQCSFGTFEVFEDAQTQLYPPDIPDTPPFFPSRRAAATFAIQASSQVVANVETEAIVIAAPAGFTFLRECAAEVLPSEAWTLRSCKGRSSEATLQLTLNKVGEETMITLRPRAPVYLRHGQLLDWRLASMGDRVNYESSGLKGPPPVQMAPVLLQPVALPFFQMQAKRQKGQLMVVPSFEVPVGSFLDVWAPRHESFVFDETAPCAVVNENPEFLSANSSGDASVGSSEDKCKWPAVFTCRVTRWGTHLALQVAENLNPKVMYCFAISIVGSENAISLPIAASSHEDNVDGSVYETSATIWSDYGKQFAAAPFVSEVLLVSLCYDSRIPQKTSKAVVATFSLASLKTTEKVTLEILFCVKGASLENSQQRPSATKYCSLLEPTGLMVTCEPISTGMQGAVCFQLLSDEWKPFTAYVLSLALLLQPGAIPSASLRLFDSAGRLAQAGDFDLRWPVLPPLGAVQLAAPRDASTSQAFHVKLDLDWATIGAAFLTALTKKEEEDVSYLDIALPQGIRISMLSCKPIACVRIIPDAANPVPGVRIHLKDQPSVPMWLLGSQDSGNSISSGDVLPSKISFLALSVRSHNEGASDNMWYLVLRSKALRALGAETLLGFGIYERMDMRITSSSSRAGDVFSRFVISFRLQTPLLKGDVVEVSTPAKEVECNSLTVAPSIFVNPFSGSESWAADRCAFTFQEPLRAGIFYSFNVPLRNPLMTPTPNVWFVRTFKGVEKANQTDISKLKAHAVAQKHGFEVFGEFDLCRILPKSAVPASKTPAVIYFRLRTAMPDLSAEDMVFSQGAFRKALPYSIRVEAVSTATFDSNCFLDVVQSEQLLDRIPGSTLIMPNDCLVFPGGTVVEFFLDQRLERAVSYSLWTNIANPTAEAWQDPLNFWKVATLFRGQVVQRIAFSSEPLQTLRAILFPASHVGGVRQRMVVRVTAGRTILGQRGAVEVKIPDDFAGTGSCDRDHFKSRPSLPRTALCTAYEKRIVVSWRTLLGGANKLVLPFEFSFALTNADVTSSTSVTGWQVTMYEGENQELAMDRTVDAEVPPLLICPKMESTLRADPDGVLSIVFQASQDLPESFENVLRVELLSSSRKPATLLCPETSLWQRRQGLEGHLAEAAQGLPRYTVCVENSARDYSPKYLDHAGQHRSAVMFLLPYQRLRVTEPYAIEVRTKRPETGDDVSELEAADELLVLYMEHEGSYFEGAAVPLNAEVASRLPELLQDGGSNSGRTAVG